MIRMMEFSVSNLVATLSRQDSARLRQGKPTASPAETANPDKTGAEENPSVQLASLSAKALSEAAGAAKRLKDSFEEGRKVADGLRESMNASRRAMAAETVERLKKMVKDLSAMALANPKGVARMVRLLSRQLAKAVADYADAAGSDAEAAKATREAEAAQSAVEKNQAAAETPATEAAPRTRTDSGPKDKEGAAATPDKPAEAKAGTSSGAESKDGTEKGVDAEEKSSAAEPAPAVDPAEQAKAQRERVRKAYMTAGAAIAEGGGEEKFLRDVEIVRRALESLLRLTISSLEDEKERKEAGDETAQNLDEVKESVAAIREIRSDATTQAVSAALADATA